MSTVTAEYRHADIRRPEPMLTGVDARLRALVGSFASGQGVVGEFLAKAIRIGDQRARWAQLDDGTLEHRLLELREQFRRRRHGFEAAVPDALGAVREAAFRRIGLLPHVVQIAGALALYRGTIAEMATGEGKTLAAAMAATLFGWSGDPCHIVTVNDYLAERDARWMEPLYTLCGVSVGCVIGEMEPDQRRKGHAADVTYTTSKEITADFLRDRLWLGRHQHAGRRQIAALLGHGSELSRGLVMRGVHTAIVDEADSILIDEAVTPLIISRHSSNEPFVQACRLADTIASNMRRSDDYQLDERYREVTLSPGTRARLRTELRQQRQIYAGIDGQLDLVEQAVTARELFHRDHQYVVEDDRVVIVDEFTGRKMPQRTWRAGLHQLIEAKEGLQVTAPTETLARLSFQRFFRYFHRLAGMTGTAREAAAELWDIYELVVVDVPPDRRPRRRVQAPRVFATSSEKRRAIIADILAVHAVGRPVLVGTRSVAESELLGAMLQQAGAGFDLLNAVKHREEATIVRHAGERSAITIATNMAGRGTDIQLADGVAAIGGLHVIATELHESQRIDRQLFGRAARQGDPGSARGYISVDDELIVRYAPAVLRRAASAALRARLPGGRLGGLLVARLAQVKAQRLAYRRRRAVLSMDTWLDDSLSFAARDVD